MHKILLLSLIFITSCNNKVTNNSKSQPAQLKPLKIEPTYIIHKGEIKYGQGMFQALRKLGIDNKYALEIINNLRDKVEFSKLKVGDKLVVKYLPTESNKKIHSFSFSNNPAEKHILIKNDLSWDYTFEVQPTFWKSRILSGKLRPGSTLQADLISQGLSRQVVADIINVLICKVNFRLYARAGDEYSVLLKERLFEDRVLETEVLYTSYNGNKAGDNETFYYEDGEKSTYSAHYTEEGEALIRSGLRYPVNRLHIRSGYGKRRHPVTGRYTMHRGVDLRGRVGSPVYAVARGLVVESSYNDVAGNKIAIKHNDGSISYYLHLHKKFVRKGQRVKAHQQIGQIGATGRVTGPHLHFGFKRSNGRWMNPMNKRMIATPKLKGERYKELTKQVAEIRKIYQSLTEAKLTKTMGEAQSNI